MHRPTHTYHIVYNKLKAQWTPSIRQISEEKKTHFGKNNNFGVMAQSNIVWFKLRNYIIRPIKYLENKTQANLGLTPTNFQALMDI